MCEIEKILRQEVRQLCKRSYTSTFHASKPSEVKSFTYEEQEKEHVAQCPISYRIVTAAAIKKKNLKINVRKSSDTINRAILTGIGIILNASNQNLNVHQMLTSTIIPQGGANKMAFRRLVARGLCLPYQSTLKNQTNLARNQDIKILQRKQRI